MQNKKFIELKKLKALARNMTHSRPGRFTKAIKFSAKENSIPDDNVQPDVPTAIQKRKVLEIEEQITKPRLENQQTISKKMKKSPFDSFKKPRKISNAKRRMLRDRRLKQQNEISSQDLGTSLLPNNQHSNGAALNPEENIPQEQYNYTTTEKEFMHHQEPIVSSSCDQTHVLSEQVCFSLLCYL